MAESDVKGKIELCKPSRRGLLPLYAGVFAVFSVLYAATAQRGPAWQDSGIFGLRVLDLDLHGWLGVSCAHPTLILLGKAASLLPFGSLSYRLNLVSSLFAALSVANISSLILRLRPRRPGIALISAAALGFGQTLWWLGTILESQAVFLAVFTLELHVLLTLVRRPRARWVLLLGLLNGVGLSTHNLALLSLPAYGVGAIALSCRRRVPWWTVVGFVVAWCIGASLWIALVIQQAVEIGFVEALRGALFGAIWQDSVLVGSMRALRMGPMYVVMNFPNFVLPAALVGVVVLRREVPRSLAVAFGYLLCAHFAFAVRYQVPDQFMFFLPTYAMLTLMAAMGLDRLTRDGRRRWLLAIAGLTVLWTPVVYAAAPWAWRKAGLGEVGRRDLVYRDSLRYWLVPWKHNEDSAGRWARGLLREAPSGSRLLLDNTAAWPVFWVQRRESLGRDVALFVWEPDSMTHDDVPLDRPLYVASRSKSKVPDFPQGRVHFVRPDPNSLLWRVDVRNRGD